MFRSILTVFLEPNLEQHKDLFFSFRKGDMMCTCSTFVVVLDVDCMNRANITNKRCSMISSRIIESAIHLRKSAISSLQLIDQNSPKLSLGKHNVHGRTVHVIRIFKTINGKQKCFEYSITAPIGKKLLTANQKVFLVRKALAALSSDDLFVTQSIRSISKAPEKPAWLDPDTNANTPTPSSLSFSIDEWLSLSEWNDPRITNGYRHGNHVFRSKSELMIAQLLESLGLEYKYEPLIMIGGTERRPDFAVLCPETMRYFFIEHLGLLSDARYRMDAIAKMEQYDKAGIRDGIDIIYTTEFGQGGFDIDAAYGKIAGAILAQSKSV